MGYDGYEQVIRNIKSAVQSGINISINRVLLKNYTKDLEEQIEFVNHLKINLKLLDLYYTDDIGNHYEQFYIAPEQVLESFVASGVLKFCEEKSFNRNRRVYSTRDGGTVEYKLQADCTNKNDPICLDCSKKNFCLEGYADYLRVFPDGKGTFCYMRRETDFDIFNEKVEKHKLEMKLVDVEYTFDGSKISFFFTADGRIDFRELVKDLAATFRTRIELRQIGVRDEAKTLGGIGICGRELCCKSFLGEFIPVSIKMAKEQNLSLNPTKISGNCGRLMCCLKYEQEAYEELGKTMPRNGAFVQTPDGKGVVISVNLVRQVADVKLEDSANVKQYKAGEIKVLKNNDQKIDKSTMQELKELED